jgi:O-antigen ligase
MRDAGVGELRRPDGLAVARFRALSALQRLITPEAVALAAGPWLFVQAAVIRLPEVTGTPRAIISSSDEAVLAILGVWILGRAAWRGTALIIPRVALAILAFVAVALAGTFLNEVPIPQAASGTFLALKAPAWFVIAANLRLDGPRLRRYCWLIGFLFVATAAIGLLQVLGVDMPWETHTRRTGDVAATSIWNQHTVFGSAMAVGVGLGVAALAYPPSRRWGFIILVATSVGVVLSTVRRLHIALPLAGLAVVLALGRGRRIREAASDGWRWLRGRPVALAAAGAGTLLVLLLVVPYGVRMVDSVYDEYVLDAADRDRYELYGGAFAHLGRSPLIGRGPGTYGSWSAVLFDSEAHEEVGVSLPVRYLTGAPYASLLAEFGLIGAAAYLLFVLGSARTMAAIARSAPGTIAGALAVGAGFLIIDFAIESVVHIAFIDSMASYFCFGAAGLALAGSASPDRHAVEVRFRR